MSDVELRVVDVSDDAALRAWWEVGAAVTAHDRPYDAWPAWEVGRASMRAARSDLDRTRLLAVQDGEVVGHGLVVWWLLDNPRLAELEVRVLPGHRRRGVGRTLLAELERRAAAEGRTTYVATTHAPVEAESPGSLFAAAHGYPVASAEASKLLDLATAAERWPALEDDVAAHLGGYRVAAIEDHVPTEWAADFCGLLSSFMTMVPSGDLDLEAAAWTPARLAEHEERTAAAGRAWLVAVGVAPDGRLAGFTELGVTRADPRLAIVGGTLVLPEHRGHRLGLGLKLATHRRLLELFPACPVVVTTNAGVNAPMNAVNEALGYRVVERCLDVQKRT
ncbi:GNAT family N-acetyltransferase [Nocardioides sp. W7]|uniref:GNAT family N-acetyltransferase n=1 Tax=Nocardioides sp. W7 TaxID=2931390 RepID=UPI001FD54006|nr:GNAT family N-acetyltransferase [Nocardioides sp. W7]